MTKPVRKRKKTLANTSNSPYSLWTMPLSECQFESAPEIRDTDPRVMKFLGNLRPVKEDAVSRSFLTPVTADILKLPTQSPDTGKRRWGR